MIELPSEIHDELTLALVKAQLPPGLAIAIRGNGSMIGRRLYVGSCARRRRAIEIWDPYKGATTVVAPHPERTCTFCGYSVRLHEQPARMEVRDYDRTLIIEHKGETFILRR